MAYASGAGYSTVAVYVATDGNVYPLFTAGGPAATSPSTFHSLDGISFDADGT